MFSTTHIICFLRIFARLDPETREFNGRHKNRFRLWRSSIWQRRLTVATWGCARKSTVNARESWHACLWTRARRCARPALSTYLHTYLPTHRPSRSLVPRWFPGGIPGDGTPRESLFSPWNARPGRLFLLARGVRCSRLLPRFTDFTPSHACIFQAISIR